MPHLRSEFLFQDSCQSVGEIVSSNSPPDDEETQVDGRNLDQIEVTVPDDHTNVVKLNEEVTLTSEVSVPGYIW